jgi:hypothetical protein
MLPHHIMACRFFQLFFVSVYSLPFPPIFSLFPQFLTFKFFNPFSPFVIFSFFHFPVNLLCAVKTPNFDRVFFMKNIFTPYVCLVTPFKKIDRACKIKVFEVPESKFRFRNAYQCCQRIFFIFGTPCRSYGSLSKVRSFVGTGIYYLP